MRHGLSACIASLLLSGVLTFAGSGARAAEIFYMDHDPSSNEFTGPVGPLVLSGEIEPGDYARLLAKIAESEDRFLADHRIILAVDGGEVSEIVNIANLVRATFTEVVVGPLTGSCLGECFLIYAAAAERGTDRGHLLGLYRPQGAGDSSAASVPDAPARVRAYLEENAVPGYLIEELFKHGPADAYWLSVRDEENLGAKSLSFKQLLSAKCGWSEELEHAVYRGEKPMADLKAIWTCQERLTRPAARYVLDTALNEITRGAAPGNPKKAAAGAGIER